MREDQPTSVWKEKELLDGKEVDAGVIILRTSGCSHFHSGGCSMCGYNVGADRNITPDSITRQFEHAVRDLGDVRFLKIYTSGSFLDECEVPSNITAAILRYCSERNMKLLFESRPEYVTEKRLDEVATIHDDLEIALGLESSNDRILKYSINKGFSSADYVHAAELIDGKGLDIRTYVLLKPPFLTEAEAMKDSISTIAFASEKSTTVSLNPVNVQKGTLVEKLWMNWAYRPPWLWTVLEVLKSASNLGTRIVCEPTGGGRDRGAHNCGKCDDTILHSLKAYTLNQDSSKLGAPECECRDLWRAILETEGFVVGGTCDLQRFFRPEKRRT